MKKLVVLGCVSVDSIVYMDDFPEAKPQTLIADRFHETVGSTGSGKALNLAKLGFDVNFHAMLGDDYYGHKIIDFLSDRKNLKFKYNFDVKPTQRHCNIMNKQGQRISIFVTTSSDNIIGAFDKVENIINDSDAVVLNIASYCKDYIPLLKKVGKEIWCDMHDYNGSDEYHQDFIDCTDHIFMSSDNCPNYKDVMLRFLKSGKKIIVCTHGKEGATILLDNGSFKDYSIIDKYKMIDTNGAGDSFMSGFMFGYYKGFDLDKSMKMALVNGGLCINSKEIVSEKLNPEYLLSEYKKYF